MCKKDQWTNAPGLDVFRERVMVACVTLQVWTAPDNQLDRDR